MLKELLDEIKGFKYQITVKALLQKDKLNGETEFAPVYFNSTTKAVINFKYGLAKSFQEVLYIIEHWINEGSGWTIVSVDAEYVNISVYSPLWESTYIKLSCELKNPIKGLISIKNNDIKNNNKKCFLWCNIRHLNPLKRQPGRITKSDKKN